jgi:hypothetical protein
MVLVRWLNDCLNTERLTLLVSLDNYRSFDEERNKKHRLGCLMVRFWVREYPYLAKS